ncbi:protein-tyrosine phosphatase [Trypanosoma rangeli]|uniref:Protein-tyrosine phosphatase n=1 Tax=Trypanosoma rangeli TaxID=5698 RepID=A0A422NY87_TRYRA|nr:protein-tyrosine phosphatase [Trypanosoma rangeli]RNF10418.1 protein-tyrosine phosphatase [Trypanosoma rangeli]|eukprot:RNF10418.1 protein-tyrosine phosphatase [Trypanosoma rangeli]
MASCSRGILIAGVTNRARTQMAEGILRCLTANTVFIKSGGVHHEATVHPLAVKVMRDIGIDISGQFVSSLESARRQRDTYDAYISIDCSYDRRTTDKTQRPSAVVKRHVADVAQRSTDTTRMRDDEHGDAGGAPAPCEDEEQEEGAVYYDPLLVPSMPSHWEYGADATDARRCWKIWSPRDPSIFHETSTRKFQDHLYAGEPLFMQLHPSGTRARMKVSERWEMDEISTRYALECRAGHEDRFLRAREDLLQRCAAFLSKLEKHYGESLLLDAAVLRGTSLVS